MRAWDYPKDVVVIRCNECGREGRYSKARFIEIVGRDIALPNALKIIAKDCPRVETGQTMRLHNRCRVHYPDLG